MAELGTEVSADYEGRVPLDRFRRAVAVPVERYRDEDAAARLSRVVRPFLLRRVKSDPAIAPELPAKTELDQVVPLTAEQTTLYEAVVRETLADILRSGSIDSRTASTAATAEAVMQEGGVVRLSCAASDETASSESAALTDRDRMAFLRRLQPFVEHRQGSDAVH